MFHLTIMRTFSTITIVKTTHSYNYLSHNTHRYNFWHIPQHGIALTVHSFERNSICGIYLKVLHCFYV